MKCPSCEFENKPDNQFCIKCGTTLSQKCSQCGSDIEPGALFCGKCGTKLGSSGPDLSPLEKKIDKIQRYLPKGLTDKILAQRDRIEGERKIVTVLFCDLVGYTSMASKLDPEDTFNLMDQVSEILIHKVHDYGGTVNQWTGDGLYALFGAPIALEDGPQRAIRSAMDMHKELTKFSEKITKEKDIPPLRMRIGINTGPVVMGTIGNSLRVDFTALGDTVNLGSRMEGLAEPGTIYVTEETFKQTEHYFRFEALGRKKIKGIDTPMCVYKIIDRSHRSTRFDVSAERGLTPLVGRERELEILLDGFEIVKSSRGQAFSIVAEAGSGKSRLLYEFRKAIANQDVTILEGKCLSYAKNASYLPVIDILKANFRIEDDDNDKVIQEKVTSGLALLDADIASTKPYLLDLLSVKDSGVDLLEITSALKKDRIIQSLQRIAIKGSELRPLIMIYEDLHWVDTATESLLKETLETIPGSRVMLLFSYRPEFIHSWGAKSYHSQINLNRLSNRESLSMLFHILDSKDVESDLADLVLAKTEGVPFYIEEFVKSLLDLKIIEKKDKFKLVKDVEDLAIPSSIQDVIMAKVDSLPDTAREVLQAGSVIEREFSLQLVKQVVDLNEPELLSNLSLLKDSELLYERGIFPNTMYIFKHAIAREVVYDSILSKRKKKLHNLIGAAIEEAHHDKIEEHFEILTEHFLAGENYEKGAESAKMAVRKAAGSALWSKAADLAEKQVICLERLPMTESFTTQIINARARLARFYLYLTRFTKAKETVDPVIKQAERLNLRRNLADIYNVLGNYYWYDEEDIEESNRYIEKGLQTVDENDYLSLANLNLFLGITLAGNADYERALDSFNKALELAESRINLPSFEAVIKLNLSFTVYVAQGRVDLAYQTSESALRIAQDQDESAKGMAFGSHGVSCFYKGMFAEAEDLLLKATTLTAKTGNFAWLLNASMILLAIHFMKGEYGKLQPLFDNYTLALKYLKMPSIFNMYELLVTRYKILSGQDADISRLSECFNNIKIKHIQSSAASAISDIYLNVDNQHMNEAEKWIQKTIELSTQNRTNLSLGMGHHLYSELFKRQNNLPKAREQLNKVISIMKDCGADDWVERYEKELAELN